MKNIVAITFVSLASVLSFGASAAAHQVSAQEAQNLQPMGSISVSQVGSTPMDMQQMLSKKADAEGASAYRVVEARSGGSWHATAELYK